MIFFDFEVFKYDWMVVLCKIGEEPKTIINDSDALIRYYEANVHDVWVGFNCRNYDQFILKGIVCGFNPKEINDWIIIKQNSGYQFSSMLNQVPLNFFDVMPNPPVSLKTLEAFMGMSIKETDIAFDIDRKLTEEELKLTELYCLHDVEATIEVFFRRKEEFDSTMSLLKTFKLPLEYIGKTKAQLAAIILDCSKRSFNDEWDIEFIDTLRISKYKEVIDWYKDPNNRDYKKSLEIDIAGVKHIFAWGGLHGAIEKYHGKGLLIHVDVNSFYPAIMIEYGLLSRAVKNPNKYREIRDKRLEYKKAKDPLQAPYKIVLNGTYGICKDKYSAAYDPRRANEVCVNGQLLLLDLIEHLEVIPGFQLVQSNTDGLIISIPDNDECFGMVDDICYEWETRCRMGLGFDYIREIYQKDVNNYLFVSEDAPTDVIDINSKKAKDWIERKGAYVKKNNDLDNDMPIINTAIAEYMVNGIPIEDTILGCKDLLQFQKVVKVSSKYLYGVHNDEKLNEKVFRVFASKNRSDDGIYKVKMKNTKTKGEYLAKEKFANTPDHCFIFNGGAKDYTIPSMLDLTYYIKLTKKRLEDYGIEVD